MGKWQESTYNPEYCQIAHDVLAGGESMAAVCAEIGIARSTLYLWRDTHPEFALALNSGLQKAQRDWERIGRDGVIGEIDKFGGTAWIFTMKNRFREDYAEDKDKNAGNSSLVEQILNKLVE